MGRMSAKRRERAENDTRTQFLMVVERKGTRNFANWRNAGLQIFLPILEQKRPSSGDYKVREREYLKSV